MKTTKYIVPVLLGLGGGLVASLGVNWLQSEEEEPGFRHELAGPGRYGGVERGVERGVEKGAERGEDSGVADGGGNGLGSGAEGVEGGLGGRGVLGGMEGKAAGGKGSRVPAEGMVQRVGMPVGGAAGSVDLRAAAQRTVPAVVNVTPVRMGRVYYASPLDFWFGVGHGQVREEPLDMGIGSGVIITEDGYIITNNHVIEQSNRILVTLNDKRQFEARLVGTDPSTDIALLKIEAEGLVPIAYGDSDDVELGEWVLAVGNPYNLTSTVTAGIISAKARGLGGRMNLESFLQTDAAVNPGNSGGALVNARGELIGINTAIQSPTGSYSGYSFAVPVNVARKVVGDLKKYGRVQRAVLGIRMRELTPTLARELGLAEGTGILVAEVVRGGAAEKAGLRGGDVVLGINGYDVRTTPQLQEQLAQYAPGDVVRVSYNRDGKVRETELTLQSAYGDVEAHGWEEEERGGGR